jgi:hypothetical protein
MSSKTFSKCVLNYRILIFNVCGSVHIGNICFIQIQLDVQYSFFLEMPFALHVSDVTCILRQTPSMKLTVLK